MHPDHHPALAHARLHDLAKAHAHQLRQQAIAAFWQQTGSALRSPARALLRALIQRGTTPPLTPKHTQGA